MAQNRKPRGVVRPRADSFDSYVRSIRAIPMLAADEEQALAERKNSDAGAADALVQPHLRLVVATARGYAGYGLPLADLVQEGSIGLLKAVKGFDPTRGVRFSSYALHWIKAEIHEYVLRNWRIVRTATTKSQRKLFFNLRSLTRGTAAAIHSSDALRIAGVLDVSARDVLEMDGRMRGVDLPLDGGAVAGVHAPINYLTDGSSDPARAVETAETERLGSSSVSAALDGLDIRSRRIVEARRLGGKVKLRELAVEFAISAERVRQIESDALRRMRVLINAQFKGAANAALN